MRPALLIDEDCPQRRHEFPVGPSFGIGPEFKYTNPVKHFSFDFRYERQFGVQAKTQGDVYVIGLT